jgi:hypothetical protein
MSQESLGVLRVRRVTGVRVYDELRIRKMLNEQERVDRHDDNVLVSMAWCEAIVPMHAKVDSPTNQ